MATGTYRGQTDKSTMLRFDLTSSGEKWLAFKMKLLKHPLIYSINYLKVYRKASVLCLIYGIKNGFWTKVSVNKTKIPKNIFTITLSWDQDWKNFWFCQLTAMKSDPDSRFSPDEICSKHTFVKRCLLHHTDLFHFQSTLIISLWKL